MIGRQINFYLAGDDQRRLLDAINQEVGCALICRNDLSSYRERRQFDRDSNDWAAAYLCEPSSIEATLRSISVSADASEVLAIEFMQPTMDGNAIQRGRFWYAPKFTLGNSFTPKPKIFIDWASGVFKIAKRELSTHRGGDWIGQEALALCQGNALTLTS